MCVCVCVCVFVCVFVSLLVDDRQIHAHLCVSMDMSTHMVFRDVYSNTLSSITLS